MSELQVRFTFNDSLMEKYGIEKCSVYHTLKKHFEQRGLVCVSDDEVFLCSGKEKDYGSIWAILIALIKGNWLLKCAVSCEYIENGKSEDVLRQIPELRKLYKKIRKGIPENRAAIEAITLSDSITPRRQVYLRLSKQKLKKYYPRPNCSLNPRYYRKAWKDIENIMTAQGFECKNHSLYISTEPVTNAKVNIIINAVGKNLKWFPKCLTAIDVESVGEKRDLTGYFRKIKSISMNIRKMRINDYEEVYGLWMSCAGMGLNNLDDSKAGIDKFLKRNPDTCFIAKVGNKLVGTIMVGNDGRRG